MEIKRKLSDSDDYLQNQPKKTSKLTETDFINYVSVPRLESMVIVKVVSLVCKLPDVKSEMMRHTLDPFYRETCPSCCVKDLLFHNCRIEKNILSKLSLLPLPNLIKAKVTSAIRPIESEIFKWLNRIRCNIKFGILCSMGNSPLDSLCWTPLGFVDRAKSLEQLIEANYNSSLLECKHTAQRIFELAATFCIEDIIPSLWKKLAAETKVNYQKCGLYDHPSNFLISYWSSICRKIKPHVEEQIHYKNMFLIALYNGNILAVKYFWERLGTGEIISNLVKWVNETIKRVDLEAEDHTCDKIINEYPDVLYFLLSKMSAETQREVIQKNSRVILQSLFLYRPYQKFLLPTIQTLWDSLEEKVYRDLLFTIARRMRDDKMAQRILKELWLRSPMNFKQCFIHHIKKDIKSSRFVLYNVLAMGDMDIFKEIVKYASVEEQKLIVKEIITVWKGAHEKFSADKFSAVFQETSLTESDILNLKEQIGLK